VIPPATQSNDLRGTSASAIVGVRRNRRRNRRRAGGPRLPNVARARRLAASTLRKSEDRMRDPPASALRDAESGRRAGHARRRYEPSADLGREPDRERYGARRQST